MEAITGFREPEAYVWCWGTITIAIIIVSIRPKLQHIICSSLQQEKRATTVQIDQIYNFYIKKIY